MIYIHLYPSHIKQFSDHLILTPAELLLFEHFSVSLFLFLFLLGKNGLKKEENLVLLISFFYIHAACPCVICLWLFFEDLKIK